MARKMQKLLSMVLALSMCMSLLSITALAEGEGESSGEETRAEFSAPAGENGDGEGTVKDPKITVTESSETKDGTTTTTTTKEWEGQDPKDPDDAEKPANPDGTETPEAPSTPATGPVTKVEGEETTVESTVTDSNGNTLKESGTVDGKETLTTTETKTETANTEVDPNASQETLKSSTTPETKTEASVSDVVKKDKDATDPIDMDAKSDVNFSGTSITVTPGTEGSQTVNGTVTDAQIGSVKETLGISGLDTDYTKNTDGTYTKTETTYVTDTDGKEQLDAAGNKIVAKTTTITVKPVYAKDQDGKDTKTIIGYTKTESTKELTDTTTDTSKGSMTKVENSTVTSDNGAATTITSKKVEKLPAKPDGKEPVTNTDGSVTTTTVEEIKVKLNEGDTEETVVGYKVSTVTTKDGKTVATTCKTTYGTVTTTTVTTQPRKTETDYTQTVTTTTTNVYAESEDISTAVVDPGEGKVTVTMGKVENNSTTTTSSYFKKSDMEYTNDGKSGFDDKNQLYNRPADGKDLENESSANMKYTWKGEYGIESTIRVNSTGTGKWDDTYTAHQFILRDKDGNEQYVYCADFDVSPKNPWKYDMENVTDADYYNTDGANHIRYIAQNGYWGTKNTAAEGETPTMGSLDAFKATLVNSGQFTADELKDLTAGQALTATQAAIWHFGNSGTTAVNKDDVVGRTYTSSGFTETSSKDEGTVQKIFEYLITQKKAPEQKTTILDGSTIQSSTVKIGEKQETGYSASVSFTLGVTPSGKDKDALTLTLSYYDATGVYHSDTKKLSEFGINETDNTYTFTDLNIGNNTTLDLKLEGTHELETGVYLFSSEVRTEYNNPKDPGHTSQTFVGIAKGEQAVNLSTTLTIKFDDPTSEMNTSGSTKEQTSTEKSSATHTDTITKTDFFNTNTTTTETVDQTEWEWHEEWEKTYSYNGGSGDDDDDDDDDDDVIIPGDDDDDDDDDDVIIPGDTPTTDIPSDLPAIDIPSDIPATNVPKTGDLSVLWYALSACSGLGLAGTALLGRKRRDDED